MQANSKIRTHIESPRQTDLSLTTIVSRSLTAGDPQGAIRECLSTSPERYASASTSLQSENSIYNNRMCRPLRRHCATHVHTHPRLYAEPKSKPPSQTADPTHRNWHRGRNAEPHSKHPLPLTEACTGPAALNPNPNTVPTHRNWSKGSNAEPHSKHLHQNWHRGRNAEAQQMCQTPETLHCPWQHLRCQLRELQAQPRFQ